jgi:hypothetical protein
MKEAPSSSETSVLTRATRRNNPEDTILHSHRRENLKSYKEIVIFIATTITTSNLDIFMVIKMSFKLGYFYHFRFQYKITNMVNYL